MVTICIPSKNNLRYLKLAIESIKRNSAFDNEVFVYVDKDDDGTSSWLDNNNVRYILNEDSECKGIGHAYDTLFREASNDLVVAFHADMVLAPGADKAMVNQHKRNTIVSATRIEPPLHPPGPEKIVMDLGMWPEDFNLLNFDSVTKDLVSKHRGKLTKSTFAPWLIHREDHLGHDPLFLSVFEDADLFRRFKLAGYDTVQTWDAFVYHLTCRGGQFLGAEKEEDFQKKDALWLKNNQISMLEYIRKWGGFFKEYGPCEPRPNVKYDVGLRAKNCIPGFLGFEPYFNSLEVDIDPSEYIYEAQKSSKFDIKQKFVNDLKNDIILEVNFSNYSEANSFQQVISNIEEILEQAEPNSQYEIEGIKLIVKTKKPEKIIVNLC